MIRLADRSFCLLLLASFIFARTVGGELPHYIFYCLALLMTSSYLWVRHLVPRLTCTLTPDRRTLAAGEDLQVRVWLYNEGMLPAPLVEIEDLTAPNLADDSPRRQLRSLGPARSAVTSYRITALRRGHHQLGPVRAKVYDPLGIFVAEVKFQESGWLRVHPPLRRLETMDIPGVEPLGRVRTRRRGWEDPTSVADLRPYLPGDPPRHIHWKVTAHRGEIYLKQFELSTSTVLYLVPDLQSRVHAGEGPDSTEERMVEAALAIAYYALRKGMPVGLAAHGRERMALPPAKGLRRLGDLLEAFTALRADGEVPLGSILSDELRTVPPRCTVIALTPVCDRDTALGLATLMRRGIAAGLVHLPAWSYDGRRPPSQEEERHLQRLRRLGARIWSLPREASLAAALGGEGIVRRA